MSNSLAALTGVESMDEIYSPELMRDLSLSILHDFVTDESSAERMSQVQQHLEGVSARFRYRRIPLLRHLFQCTSLDELDKHLTDDDDAGVQREQRAAVPWVTRGVVATPRRPVDSGSTGPNLRP